MRPLFHFWCMPQIRITTDAWGGYNFLRPDGWRHLSVVHKRYFTNFLFYVMYMSFKTFCLPSDSCSHEQRG
eukprot:UN26617